MEQFISALRRQHNTFSFQVSGLRGSAAAFLLARTAAASGKPLLALVPSEQEAQNLEQDLALFTDVPVYSFPAYDIPPYTPLSPDPATVAVRLATLYRIYNATTPFILAASVETLLRRILPKELLTNLAELLLAGEETDQHELIANLANGGYNNVSMVQTAGEYSVRGGIIDIFSPGFDYPVRLDFFGDTVESIRLFDPISQRSVEQLDEIILLPASDTLFPAGEINEEELELRLASYENKESPWKRKELYRIVDQLGSRRKFPGMEFYAPLLYEKTSGITDYLPAETIIFSLDGAAINNSIDLSWERIELNHSEAEHAGIPALPPEHLFITGDELQRRLGKYNRVSVEDFPSSDITPHDPAGETPARNFEIITGNHKLLKQDIELNRKQLGLLGFLAGTISNWQEQQELVAVCCRSAARAKHLAELLKNYDIRTELLSPPFTAASLTSHRVGLFPTPLTQGFDLHREKIHLVSESELFGEKRLGKSRRRWQRQESEAVSFEEINCGDIVVHRDHGLGIYDGLVNLQLNGICNDFMQIIYQGDDRLYVPVDRINVVTKYKGVADKQPKIDKLGGKSWFTTKKKVKDAVWKVAHDLLELYAKRKLDKGTKFSMPDSLYYDLEESFPFDETAGQLKAINDVIADLVSEQSMDRLVCGDVGYGKTEVAVRGAFKVVTDSRQVAVLVPTTVLAEQHAQTFRERFHGFPVTVECLNRFRTPAEQREIIKGLQSGAVDIVIGTHRLLSRDVIFNRLGLLIIDEEHRFGVTHKERLKKLKTNVDVLTLTATPIPRTLQMSLLGIRDLSVISTPPQQRRTVKTYIAKYDDLIIKEAVNRELQRSGQAFIVHNRVKSIHEMAKKVQRLVPQARIAVAHGQMPGKNLEEIMVDFVHRRVDVLVCTTIIESGLDIPNANTIIITNADRFGLAEIYQLRGRVGRSNEQAYAYLLMPSMESLSKDAQQRLRALMDYNELGGGFKLAMSDLQIRGGGNLLGESQSGNIAAVGYDLYLDLLQKTVEDLKHREAEGDYAAAEEVEPEINLNISAYIPEDYITDISQRYFAYRKIANIRTPEQQDDLIDELTDRYGPLPSETENLFTVMALKTELRKYGISKLEQGQGTIVFTFDQSTPIAPENILAFVGNPKNKARFTPDSRLVIKTAFSSRDELISGIKNILRGVSQDDTK